jgi:hypothetical protein
MREWENFERIGDDHGGGCYDMENLKAGKQTKIGIRHSFRN